MASLTTGAGETGGAADISAAIRTALEGPAQAYNISLTPAMLDAFAQYARLLLKWNARVNLTAITAPGDIAAKHFLDSLLPLRAHEFAQGASLLDVGAGAGFPGVPLKIARPDLHLSLLDSTRKRLAFLEELARALGQQSTLLHARAEEAGRLPGLRERFDIVTARAVARLAPLCEYCLPFVKPGGVLLVLKGPGAGDEIREAKAAVALLGGKQAKAHPFTLPGGEARHVVVIEKVSQTPTKYPRRHDKITKAPL